MVVSFSRNIFLQLYCRIENKIINIDGKRWRNGRHKCRCHVCGKVLDSKKDKYSPKECGWMRLKDRKIYDPWICHSCLEHYKHGKWNNTNIEFIRCKNWLDLNNQICLIERF